MCFIMNSREVYKFYSGIDPIGYICSIGTNVFSDILGNSKDFIDGKTFKLSDLDLLLLQQIRDRKRVIPGTLNANQPAIS